MNIYVCIIMCVCVHVLLCLCVRAYAHVVCVCVCEDENLLGWLIGCGLNAPTMAVLQWGGWKSGCCSVLRLVVSAAQIWC